MTSPEPFNVCGDLPQGVTVLEASAGTGKTFTVAALAARYVAAGTPLQHLLLVTFTRMASGELRERVRDRLVSAERGLARAQAGVAPDTDDEVLRLLADGAPEEIERRRQRLAAALADFDAATIATTHRYCRHALSSLGIAGDVEHGVTFVDDLDDLVTEVVDDLYVRRFQRGPDAPPFDRAEALRIARAAVANPRAAVEPTNAPGHTAPAMRQRLALAVRDEVERRKRRTKQITHDDLLTRLADTLRDDQRGPAACERLRQRYRVALVDEFQDTDPIQWEIMRRAFGEGGATLILIGDPKQAIYAFRGADVYAYLEAAHTAGTRQTLPTNRRSDQGLLDAYDALLGDAKLGHDDIPYIPVQALAAHQTSRLAGPPAAAPLRIRVAHRDDGLVRLTPKGYASKQPASHHIAADLAADVVGLLESGTEVVTRHLDGSEATRERIGPRHLGVLVHYNKQATLIRDALAAVDVPAVVNGAGSVFATPVATDWLRLLEALERPTSPWRARAATLTALLGWTAQDVAAADEAAWQQVHTRLHRWGQVLRESGVAALLTLLTTTEGLPERLLARVDGERTLTDLRHVGQLLHAQATAASLGVTALTAWLRHHITHARTVTSSEEQGRRLESDAEAVQVLTIHRSKGLEFPIAYYPFLWEARWIPDDKPPVFHDAEGQRSINVGGEDGPEYDDHRRRFEEEHRGEDLRLLYVALTRACHQAVVWWAGPLDSRNSPLARLLFARKADGRIAPRGNKEPPADDEVVARLEGLAEQAPGCVQVERTTEPDARTWAGEASDTGDLDVRAFDRILDAAWQRTSYTAITGHARDWQPQVASEPDEPLVADEASTSEEARAAAAGRTATPPSDDGSEQRLRAVGAPLASMPGGTAVGTLVHAVLEATDFSAVDLDAELADHLDRERLRRHIDLGDPTAVTAGLRAAIETPLGPLAGDRALQQIARGDRVDELAFELPLVGGDTPTATLTLDHIAGLLRQHVAVDDLLAGYAEALADPHLARQLRGYLAGSIDCVLRLHDSDIPRFVVCDYKTHHLGGEGEALSAWHYRPALLAGVMHQAHYPLQALLYTVALHRYLRWRLPGYDPAVNLAGVAYLFLRGMTGTHTPRVHGQPCGVFTWTPPTNLVVALSEAFDRGTAAA